MRISELSRITGLTVATIKFYLRQQLIPPGVPVTATQSEYGQVHVDRLRLIRALVDVGGLPLTSVRAILTSLDNAEATGATADGSEAGDSKAEGPRTGGSKANGTKAGDSEAGSSKAGGSKADGSKADASKAGGSKTNGSKDGGAQDGGAQDGGAQDGGAQDGGARDGGAQLRDIVNSVYDSLPPLYPPTDRAPQRALAMMKWLGWEVDAGSAALRQLEEALTALEGLGMTPTPANLQRYADAAEQVARAEVSSVPAASPSDALRYIVVGTVMYEPVLIALRRLAHQNLFNH